MTFELNPAQRAAAECLDRPVLVTAGAGSGKTRMITQRFVNAVVPGVVPGWRPADVGDVVAITFTDKAAGEIAERVRLALRAVGCAQQARALGDAWISTIHGLCSRLLRRHAFEAGIDPQFSVGDTLRVGQLRESAFEAAARNLLEDGDAAVDLFDAYEMPSLFSAAVDITRQAAVAGCSISDVQLEPVEDVAGLVGEAEALFRLGMTTCDLGYSGSSAAPREHADRCEELLGICSTLVSAEREQQLVLSDLLGALDAYKPLKNLKGLEEVAAELASRRAELSGRVAAALLSPYAEALKRLATRYADEYSARKVGAGMLDFDDLQIRAVQLLEARPDIAERYRERFRVVMIDEFQDTDALQLRLVEALTRDDLCTVGDEKQSIYRFRGADVEVYGGHRKRMAQLGALVSELKVNYRSHRDILAFVNRVFASDEYFGSSLLRLEAAAQDHTSDVTAAVGDSPRVEAIFVDSTDSGAAGGRAAEAACIATRLAELRDAGVRPRDIAVLVRTYTHAHTFAEALWAAGMPALVVGGSRFFGLPEIAIMRALNRAIANVEDEIALATLLASDFVPVTSDGLANLRLGGDVRDSRSLWTQLQEKRESLASADREAAGRLIEVLGRAGQRVGRMPLANVLLLAIEESGWDVRLLAGGSAGRDAFANVLKCVRQAETFEGSVGTGPAGFTQYLDAKERLGDTEAPASLADDGSDAVRIMSIHASKGLEFPVVVVPGLAAPKRSDSSIVRVSRQEGGVAVAIKTPSTENGEARSKSSWFERFSAGDTLAEDEERARVLYVACTRAREMLLLSGTMKLRPAKETTANNDLVRLSRILGVTIPVDGPSDAVAHAGATQGVCRVRVVDAVEQLGQVSTGASGLGSPREGVLLPPGGQARLSTESVRPPERLSYTQLSEFERCPKRYWVRRVLGLRPADSSWGGAVDPLRFGTALHAALRVVGPQGEPPPSDRVDAIARFFELGDEGTSRLRRAVARYCASDVARRAAAGQIVRRESPFAMRVGGAFLLTGSIDLYSRTGEGALVVDYKSGEKGDPEQLKSGYRLQAECYALAVLRDGPTTVTVEFVRPEVDARGDGGIEHVAFDFSAQQRDEIERDLLRRYNEIADSQFGPSPSGECAHCDVPTAMCPERVRIAGKP